MNWANTHSWQDAIMASMEIVADLHLYSKYLRAPYNLTFRLFSSIRTRLKERFDGAACKAL